MSSNLSQMLALAALALGGPVLAVPSTAPAASVANLPATARPAAATVDAFHAALRRGDTKGALALLADDALILESGGAEHGKAEYASHHLAADTAFAQTVPSRTTRRTGGAHGDYAWVASEGRITGTYKGKAVDRNTAETVVLRRTDARWKIVHFHWSSAAAKAQ